MFTYPTLKLILHRCGLASAISPSIARWSSQNVREVLSVSNTTHQCYLNRDAFELPARPPLSPFDLTNSLPILWIKNLAHILNLQHNILLKKHLGLQPMVLLLKVFPSSFEQFATGSFWVLDGAERNLTIQIPPGMGISKIIQPHPGSVKISNVSIL